MDAMDWAYWSNAEFHRLLGAVLEGGSVNPENRDAIKDLVAARSATGIATLQAKTAQCGNLAAWSQTLDALTKDAHPRFKSAYSLTSTYVHPTYRQVAAPDLGVIISCPNPFGSPPPQSLSAQHLSHKIHRFLLLTPLTQICSVLSIPSTNSSPPATISHGSLIIHLQGSSGPRSSTSTPACFSP